MKRRIASATFYLYLYFIGLAIIGSVILTMSFCYTGENHVPYIDCLFTAVSALCVTGLSSVNMNVYSTAGFVIILLLIEAGGLGLITFFTLYLALPAKKISLVNRRFVKDMFISDVDINPRSIISRILLYTLSIQTLGFILLAVSFDKLGIQNPIFNGLFFAVSAFCNAGFTTFSDSLVSFNNQSFICTVICFLIVAGGLGFTVMEDIVALIKSKITHGKKKRLSLHSHIVLFTTAILIFCPAIIYFITDYNIAFKQMSFIQKIGNAFFQSVTTRTAGFETVPQASFSAAGSFLTVILMFIGGSPGSMAGGIKTTTVFLTICYAFKKETDRNNLSVYKRDISDQTASKAQSILIKGLLFVFAALIVLFIAESKSLQENVFSEWSLTFEAFSALGTAGLSRSLTPLLSTVGKIIVIIIMFVGRTGIIATTMNIKSASSEIKRFTDYPHEPVLVG